MKVSVVINTLDRAQSLRATLESLRRLSYSRFEVIVVNGPSTDDTESVLAGFASSIHLGRCAERNLSMSRNIGIGLASGDLIAFIDDDAIPHERWLDDIVPHFDAPEVAGVGGFVFDHTGYSFQHRYWAMDRAGNGIPLEKESDHYCYPGSPLVPFLLGTNSVFRRDVVLEAGGFDEEYEYYYDEVDLCTRIIDAGYLLRQRNCGFVYHGCLPSSRRNTNRIPTNWFPIIKNKIYYSIKNAPCGNFSITDVIAEARRRVTEVEEFLRGRLSEGLITPEQFENFKADTATAIEAGLKGGLSPNRRLMKRAETEAGHKRFKPYPRAVPENRLTLCFVSQDYAPDDSAGPGGHTFELAGILTRAGHLVHVLTESRSGGNQVDYEDGVWVHRLSPQAQTWSECVGMELQRMREMDEIHLVEAPLSASL